MYATIISLKLIGFLTPHPPRCAQHLFLPKTGPFCRLRRHFPRARGNHLKEKACKAATLVKYLRIFAVSASLPCVKGGGTALSCDGGIVTKMAHQNAVRQTATIPQSRQSRDSPLYSKGPCARHQIQKTHYFFHLIRRGIKPRHLFLPKTGPFCRLRRHFPRARGNYLQGEGLRRFCATLYSDLFVALNRSHTLFLPSLFHIKPPRRGNPCGAVCAVF